MWDDAIGFNFASPFGGSDPSEGRGFILSAFSGSSGHRCGGERGVVLGLDGAPGLFGRNELGAGISRSRKVVSASQSEGLCGAFGLWLLQQ